MAELVFPKGFLWGSATSAHQVEGNNIHSDWWAWEQAGRVKDPSGAACDQYRRYAEDFELAVGLGHTIHRFSVEWARIEPVEGRWDEAAVAHYVDVVRALRQRNLEPVVTLHHFTNPQWFLAKGGWVNPEAPDQFARYVQLVVAALKGQVRYWVTINEPMVYVRMHYVQGLGPPGAKNFHDAMRVAHNLIQAHGAAYQIIHQARGSDQSRPQVSLAHHVPAFRPCRPWWPMDRWATNTTDQLLNRAFLDAVTDGRCQVPTMGTWTFPDCKSSLDYFGLNFYSRQFIRWTPRGELWPAVSCDLAHHQPREVTERTSLGWDVSPEAFRDTLVWLRRFGLPILVTENGTYMTEDSRRWSFIHRHLQALYDAIEAGANVLGYCYWSLLDNFEWAEGFGPRFGIIEVDYRTQQRRVRDSGWRYAQVCKTNRLTLDNTP